jgi:glycosyltransferase involved in cell wall biosynthesis
MKIRVAYIITPNFGSVYSGPTHRIFTMLSRWHNEEMTLELLGTKIKVLNLNSGEKDYKLSGKLWSEQHRTRRTDRFLWTLQTFWLIVKNMGRIDIFHFMSGNWSILLSPLVLHPFKKKVVFSMIRYDIHIPSIIMKKPHGKLAVKMLRKFDGMIGLAPAFIEDCQRHGFTNKMLVLPNFMAVPGIENGKDTRQGNLLREELQIPLDAVVLLYVGSDHKRKGLDVVVDTFVELSKRHPGLNLFIVGPNSRLDHGYVDEEFIARQKNKLIDAGLEGRVVWTGLIADPDRLSRYYHAADIFVFPTRAEGSPNVLAEAMFAGLPVAISLLPGITDTIVRDGEDGYLIPVGDVKGFVKALDILIRDPELRLLMGSKSRERAVELFGFDQYCQKLGAFYKELMNSSPKKVK